MAAIFTNILSNKSNAYRVMMNWTFAPGSPSISSFTASNARTSVTLSASVTAPSSGTFTVANIRGRRTSQNTYKSSGATIHVKIGSTEKTVSSGIYFNTTNSGAFWGGLTNWNFDSAAVSTSQTIDIWGTGFSSVLNSYHYNRSEANQSAQATLNLGTTQTTEYSKDNSTWQSSATFSSLTPNTTYTMYMRTKSTSASGNASGYVYKSVSAKTTGNAPTITAVGTPTVARTSVTFAKPTATYDTNASYSSQSWCSTSGGTYTSGNSATGLTPNTNYTYYVKVTDNQGRTSAAASVAFKTTGNAPTYNASAGSATRTSFIVTPSSISYDTNASFSSFKVEWGTSTSYGNSNTNTSSAAAYTVSGLSANTLYYWRTTLTDNQGRSTQKTGSITTTGNAPTVTASTTPARTSCTLAIGASYDTNASFSSGKYEYGTSTSYGTSVNISAVGNQTINSLSPNTTYYYKVSITDTKSRTGTKTGSFTTTCNAPSSLTLTRTAATSSTISVSVSATGDTNAPITKYILYYKHVTASSYTSIDLGTNTTRQVTGLNQDNNYYFYFTAQNAAGTTTSSTSTLSTILDAPTVSSVTFTNGTPTSVTENVSATGYRTPLEYLFSSDNGTTWKQHNRNLFDISRWSDAGVTVVGGASATISGGNITFTAVNNDTVTNTYHMTSSSPTDRQKAVASIYGFPVIAGQTYGMGYNSNNANASTEMYVFWYDANWNYLSHAATSAYSGTGRNTKSVTAPANAVYASFRLDNNTNGQTVTFSNIYFGIDTSATYVAYTNDTAAYNWSGLTPNTTYTFATKVWTIARAYLSTSRSATGSATYTTTANKPVLDTVTPAPYREGCNISYTATYDGGASFSSLAIQYGTTSSYGSTSTSTSITGLSPNTKYYYSMIVTDTNNLTSDPVTGDFTTTAYMPTVPSHTLADVTAYTATMFTDASGDTNANITSRATYVMPVIDKNVYDMPIKVLSDGSRWARIFYHNCKNGTVLFTTIDECKDTQTTDKYSRLGILDSGDTYKIGEKYEFMLEYPVDAPGEYNRWRQTNAPQNEYITRSSSGGQVTGYEAIHIDWTGQYWGGLERNNEDTTVLGSTWLCGSVGHTNSFYAIGCASNYGQAAIPSYGKWTKHCVELWIRIDSVNYNDDVKIFTNGTSGNIQINSLKANTSYDFVTSATNAVGTTYSSKLNQITTKDYEHIKVRKELPSEYTQLSYIENTGEHYIDTEIYAPDIREIDCRFNFTSMDTGTYNHIVFSGYKSGETWYNFGLRKNSSEALQFSYGTINKSILNSLVTAKDYDFSWNNNRRTVKIDGIAYENFETAWHSSRPKDVNMYIFAAHTMNSGIESIGSYAKAKLYYLNLYDINGNALRMYIPAKRNSDNAVGLYDFVSGNFYVGSGSDALTAGGAVAAKPKWISGQLKLRNNDTWINPSRHYIKSNGSWVKGINDKREDLRSWSSNYMERFNITYDDTVDLFKVACAGASGWERLYIPVSTNPGSVYKVSFDYYNPNGYTPLSGYTGITCQAITAIDDYDGRDTKIGEVITSATANQNIQRTSFTFTAVDDLTYISLNYGMASDGVTTTVWFGNFTIDKTEDIYQEVEYIESSGTQYIDTEIIPDQNTGIDIDLTYVDGTDNTWLCLYGCRSYKSGSTTTGDNSTYYCLYISDSNLKLSPNYAGFDPGDAGSTVSLTRNQRYNLKNVQGQYYVDNTLQSSISTDNLLVQGYQSIYLFTNNNFGTLQFRGQDFKLHNCKFYSGNTLIRDFVPVYRVRDNVIGLFDKVNKKFYTNKGTGAFTKGSNTSNKYIN